MCHTRQVLPELPEDKHATPPEGSRGRKNRSPSPDLSMIALLDKGDKQQAQPEPQQEQPQEQQQAHQPEQQQQQPQQRQEPQPEQQAQPEQQETQQEQPVQGESEKADTESGGADAAVTEAQQGKQVQVGLSVQEDEQQVEVQLHVQEEQPRVKVDLSVQQEEEQVEVQLSIQPQGDLRPWTPEPAADEHSLAAEAEAAEPPKSRQEEAVSVAPKGEEALTPAMD